MSVLGSLRTIDRAFDLDAYNHHMDNYEIAASYLSQRLLSKQQWLSPRLDMVREIALRLARDDTDSRATYPTYIQALSSVLVRQRRFVILRWFRQPPSRDFPAMYNEKDLNCDVLAAAIYTGKDALVRELCEEGDTLQRAANGNRLFGSVYAAAMMHGDVAIISYLLDKSDFPPDKYHYIMRTRLFPKAYRFCGPAVVEQLLTRFPEWTSQGSLSFLKTCVTPDVKNMNVLEGFLETMADAEWHRDQLAYLLKIAAWHGWDDMASHLLEKGAPPSQPVPTDSWNSIPPLVVACQTGAEGVVRLLLRNGASMHKRAIGEAAKRGFFGIVKVLVEHGADVNSSALVVGKTEFTPLLSALLLEHTEMFCWLVEHGAKPTGLCKAQLQGLDSMLALVEDMERIGRG
jgi:hypothetical protein